MILIKAINNFENIFIFLMINLIISGRKEWMLMKMVMMMRMKVEVE